ncbi:MAG: apolipoprotein N-acyltransferase [Proteobacteria bacterium]|nr:apolipoprotein N-acyltransferase [Pseudomonadota bacterium]
MTRRLATTWPRLLAALLFGAAAALAQAPWYLWPLMMFGYSGLLWLLQGATGSARAFVYGWVFGVGYFLVGLHWVGHAFLVDAARFAWMMPFAMLALAAGLGLFPALAAVLTWRFSHPGLGRLLALTLFWGLTEWLRGSLLTGLPWLLSGHVWAGSDIGFQAAAYLGASGLGLLAVLAAAAPALVLIRNHGARKRGLVVNAVALALVGLTIVLSVLRLQNAEINHHPGVRLRLVQAGISQADKWRPELRDQHLAHYLRLSMAPDETGQPPEFSHLIWPETATPFFLDQDTGRRRTIAQALPRRSLLITGSPRMPHQQPGHRILHNSILKLDPDGAVKAIYDKYHLVPFGEYLPLRKVLARLGLDKLAHGAVDFSPGAGPRVVKVPNLPPFRPLICYEIIFPREISVTTGDANAEWLLNLTNDAWFGEDFGPQQHLAIARLRAVEFGLPVVRVANTGISAVIDPFGRIVSQLPMATAGIIDSQLPIALPKTPYRRFGEGIFAVFCLLLMGLLIQTLRRRSDPAHDAS